MFRYKKRYELTQKENARLKKTIAYLKDRNAELLRRIRILKNSLDSLGEHSGT